jgi:hypothetical protein
MLTKEESINAAHRLGSKTKTEQWHPRKKHHAHNK